MDFNNIKEAVNSIKMSKATENRLKENISRKQPTQGSYVKWISVAGAFGVLLFWIISMPYFNQNGKINASNFTITAYALSDDGQQSNTSITQEKASIDLAIEDRAGLVNLSGDGANFIFTNVNLFITGEQIDSITYTLSDGRFVEDVTFTAKEYMDQKWLESEKINFITNEPSSDIYRGIKEIGRAYTVAYEEQKQHPNTIAIPHDSDNVIVKVDVIYQDGKSEQQEIIVTLDSNAISLKFK